MAIDQIKRLSIKNGEIQTVHLAADAVTADKIAAGSLAVYHLASGDPSGDIASEAYVNSAISAIPPVDFTGYATETYVDNSIATVLPLTGGTVTGNLGVNGNLQIDGDLTVSGTTVTINATNLAVEDNLIYLNNGSAVANPDLGIAGNYNDGTYAHAGFFRDASDGRWKVFDGYTPEPDASAFIDTADASFNLASLQATNFYGKLVGDADTVGTKSYDDIISEATALAIALG
jgi:hypothetical protein